MIQTLDFFTPIVDDPYMFGQIAAANSLSDVYAMGGEPKVALNIVGFPNCMDPEILGEIMRGGADKVLEAGAVLIGGHSVQDDEPKYGLSVSGYVHPDKIWKNHGAKEGDVLLLTKKIGSGIMNTAIKGEVASENGILEVQKVMATLNKSAKDIMINYPVSSCTDITGFGLLGHGIEMAKASEVTLEIEVNKLKYFQEAVEFAKMGLIPEGTYANKEHTGHFVKWDTVEEYYIDLLYDPQTSGGLLFSVGEEYIEDILQEFARRDSELDVSIIGKVVRKEEHLVRLTSL